MHWFRKAFVWALLIGSSSAAAAQEKTVTSDRPATGTISLGQPTPAGVFRAMALTPANQDASIQQAGSTSVTRPSVVRGAMPYFDDQLKSDAEPKAPSPFPLLPPPEIQKPGSRPTEALVQPEVRNVPKIIEVDKDGKVTVVADPPRFQPLRAKLPPPPVVISEPMAMDEHAIIVDESGSPLWGGGSGMPTRFYAQAEYLLWWTRGMHLPPLVLTDSPNTPAASLGVLGNGTAQLLYGNNDTSTGPTPGGRFTVGYALDDCGLFTLEGSFFFLGRQNSGAAFNSNQFPVLGRPFFDLNDNVPSRELTAIPLSVGAPFAATGAVHVDTTTQLFGAEVNLKTLLWCGCNFQINGLVGFRYLDLSESVHITETSVQQLAFADVDASIRPGDQATVFDSFATHNRFYGGQIGASGEWLFGRWSVEGSAKLAVGMTQQTVEIDGGQRIVSLDGRVQSFAGGLYAVPSNMGSHSRNQTGFVPELNVKLNYQLTDHISLFVGYDILYWSSVVRPGDQIDQVLDLNQVPNSGRPYPQANQVRPVVPFQTSSFWAQGVNAGVLFRY